MPRPPLEIDDGNPLDGSQINLNARIGWLLRTWRIAGGLGLQHLSDTLRATGTTTSPAALSRREVAGERDGRLIDGYERALGRTYGSLRAPIDTLCRTYDYRPDDLAPVLPPDDLGAFTTACRTIAGDRPSAPTGTDWLRWAEHHADGRFGLPTDLIAPHLTRLAAELGRAVGTGYQQRYEALARLRCSRYGDTVRDVVGALIAVPGAQRLGDLMSAVCEYPEPGLLGWCADLLDHPSDLVARAACLGIQNLRFVGGTTTEEWTAITPRLIAATRTAVEIADLPRSTLLASTIAASPPEVRATIPGEIRRLLPRPPHPDRWTRNRLNVHYTAATQMADRIAGGRYGETLLGRLLFELLFDFRATHAVTSGFLLSASAFAPEVLRSVTDAARDSTDPVIRDGAVGALASLMLPTDEVDTDPFWVPDDQDRLHAGLRIAAFAARTPDPDLLRSCFAVPPLRVPALYSAGMSGSPVLADVAADPTLTPVLRQRAQWWIDTGPRILDPVPAEVRP